jgi:TatA/E family protein of Tat protein translocase
MLDIGIQELLVIMVLALLVFGPDKLPELGRRLGRAMREFRRASDEFRSTVEQNLQIHAMDDISPPPASSFEPAVTATDTSAVTGATDSHAADGDGQVVAGPLDPGVPAESAGGGDEPLEPFWTSRGGRLFHRRECAWRARVPVPERVALKTALEGVEQGLRPCPACDPKELPVAS